MLNYSSTILYEVVVPSTTKARSFVAASGDFLRCPLVFARLASRTPSISRRTAPRTNSANLSFLPLYRIGFRGASVVVRGAGRDAFSKLDTFNITQVLLSTARSYAEGLVGLG